MILSILIPTYNRPQQVLNAVKSCLDFPSGMVEIIIGDDSKKEQHELFDKIILPENYSLIYLHRKVALKQNKNVDDLIKRAVGKYSLILHDDDFLLPGALESLISKAETNNVLNCIYFGKQRLVDEKVQLIKNNSLNRDYFRTIEMTGVQANPIRMALFQQVPSNSFLFPTKIAKELGYRDYEKVGDACDFDFVIRLVVIGKCGLFFLFEDVSGYTLSNYSVSRTENYNSIYYKYKIIKELSVDSTYPNIYADLLRRDISVLCGYYINHNHSSELNRLYFSRNYPFSKRFSLRGFYHLIRCFISKN